MEWCWFKSLITQWACDSPHELTSGCRESSELHTQFFEMPTSATLSLINGETDEISLSLNPSIWDFRAHVIFFRTEGGENRRSLEESFLLSISVPLNQEFTEQTWGKAKVLSNIALSTKTQRVHTQHSFHVFKRNEGLWEDATCLTFRAELGCKHDSDSKVLEKWAPSLWSTVSIACSQAENLLPSNLTCISRLRTIPNCLLGIWTSFPFLPAMVIVAPVYSFLALEHMISRKQKFKYEIALERLEFPELNMGVQVIISFSRASGRLAWTKGYIRHLAIIFTFTGKQECFPFFLLLITDSMRAS